MKKTFILVLLASIMFCSEDPVSPPVNQPILGAAIKGRLITSDGAPAPGVVLRLFEKNRTPALNKLKIAESIDQFMKSDSVETDENGDYSLPLPDSGIYNIIGNSSDKSIFISDVHINDTQTVEVKTDTVRLPGKIKGVTLMPGLDSVNQIRVTMYIPGTGFIVKPIPGGQFNFPKIPSGSYKLIFDPTNTSYFVKVMDITVEAGGTLNLDTILLYGTNCNGIPKVNAGGEKTVSINDSVQVSFSAADTLGRIVKYWIDSEGDGIFEDSCTNSSFRKYKAPATPEVRKFIVKVFDNDGNFASDTAIINVIQDHPQADAGADIQLMPNKSQFKLHGSGTDIYGKILNWEWNVNNTGFVKTSNGDTVIPFTWEKDSSIECVLRVTDDDGNIGFDTTIVKHEKGIMIDDMEMGDSLNENGWLRYVTDDSEINGNTTFPNFEKDSVGHYKIKMTHGVGYDSSSCFKIEYAMGDRPNVWGGHSIRAGMMLTEGKTIDMSDNKKISFRAKCSDERGITFQIRTLSDTCDDYAYRQFVDVSTEWKEITIDVTSDDFAFPEWGMSIEQHPFESDKVVGISWYAEGASNANGWLAIDNVYLHE